MSIELLSRSPSSPSHPTPLLFIHGAWHGAWCWAEHFLDYFAAHGYAAHALSLRGHGNSPGRERLRWTASGITSPMWRRSPANCPLPRCWSATRWAGW